MGCVIVVAPGGRWVGDGHIPALALCERYLAEASKPAHREHHGRTLRPRDVDLRRIGGGDISNIVDVKADLCSSSGMANP